MKTSVLSRIAFGACVTIASALASGCASINRPMETVELETFHIDCSRKEEQIALLNSMRSSRDDRLFSWITNYVQPWDAYINKDDYVLRQDISRGMTNWQINQNLLKLRHCPPS